MGTLATAPDLELKAKLLRSIYLFIYLFIIINMFFFSFLILSFLFVFKKTPK